MANRVLLGAIGSKFGLQVSKPGVNVLTNTNQEAFAFNSLWPDSAGVFLSGQKLCPDDTVTTIAFGTTLPFVPVYFAFGQTSDSSPLWVNPAVNIRVTTSSLVIDNWLPWDCTLNYHIMRYSI